MILWWCAFVPFAEQKYTATVFAGQLLNSAAHSYGAPSRLCAAAGSQRGAVRAARERRPAACASHRAVAGLAVRAPASSQCELQAVYRDVGCRLAAVPQPRQHAGTHTPPATPQTCFNS